MRAVRKSARMQAGDFRGPPVEDRSEIRRGGRFDVDPSSDEDRVANQHVLDELCRDAIVAADEDEREHA